MGRHTRTIVGAWREETKRRRALSGKPRRGSETDFLPEALEIVETPPSPFGRLIIWVILLVFGLALAWSWFGRVDIVAVAQGRVVPTGQVQVVEAPETGVVRAIRVRNGDVVAAGDVLIELDSTLASADSGTVDNELGQAELRASIARGVLGFLETGLIRLDMPEGVSEAASEVSRRQLGSRIASYRSNRLLIEDERQQAQAAMQGVIRNIAKLRETLPLLRERMTTYQALTAEGLASRVEALRLQEELITRERDLEIAVGELDQARSAVSAVERRLDLARDELRREALQDLAEAEAARTDRLEAQRKAAMRAQWQTLRAPADGTVVGLQVFTVGEVIETGAPLMTIAPSDRELIVEAMVLNKDVGFVKLGDPVAVKLEAYPFTRYGLIEGELAMISADAIIDERLGLVFPAEVHLSAPYVGEGDLRRAVQSGMNATAEVKTGDRRIIDFVLSPIAKAGSEAGRER
ncbi:HlyD family type I secretion periplasmic adaptor subunit [uncultured Algimonas sp.]|uniref:HlyD family type I secretion periplasmic adaptor subunit n=1 Tax=uncultured Algimonas sp. TaxID=1547920 RepID=UPI00260E8B20|nr:HlyD family type I secretion periplasmic adaptor subunit [uncultured Algimonas sp.]